MVHTCRLYIQTAVPAPTYYWEREWKLWAEHAWEFFHATGPTIPAARQQLNDIKQQRDWTGINWTGESSTLSGADGIAWPQLGYHNPRTASIQSQKTGIEDFYKALSEAIGESFIDPDEELSIPELVKRIITHEDVAKAVVRDLKQHSVVPLDDQAEAQLTAIAKELNPDSFKDLNRLKRKRRADGAEPTEDEEQHWTGWFLGDGDKAGDYLRDNSSPHQMNEFSAQMREWGRAILSTKSTYLPGQGRMIYAGGDDFMGVLYERDRQISHKRCFDWMSRFNQDLWQGDRIQPSKEVPLKHKGGEPKPITASVGFVWAAPNVPQRDVLQNCHAAEQAAKGGGRDRIAFRILFNGGNHLEWICPWWVLEAGHIDITKNSLGLEERQAWTHFYNDIATLESRHAFGAQQDSQTAIAQRLFSLYFGENSPGEGHPVLNPRHWWNPEKNSADSKNGQKSGPKNDQKSGLLGAKSQYTITDPTDPEYALPVDNNRFVRKAINAWVINLSKVGFHLARPEQVKSKENDLPVAVAA